MITATSKNLAEKIALHGAEYMTALEPCIVERLPDGSIVCDDSHAAWAEMIARYRPNGRSAPMPDYTNGLGTLVTRKIDAASFGMAKPLATAIAKAFGSNTCGCEARAQCLNQLVPDVTKMDAIGWASISWRILKCIGAKDDDVNS